MVEFNIQEAKGVIAAIVKENGTTKQIQTPADGTITYTSGGDLVSLVFMEAASSYSQDSSKTVNKTDLVGTQAQKISEGSIEDTMTYDGLALAPAALGDTTIEFTSGTVHGLDASVNPQYLITATGLRKLFRSANTVTVRLFIGCDLDANDDADVQTAKEIFDLERTHLSGNNFSASGGGDVTLSISFDAETITFPAAYNSAPN